MSTFNRILKAGLIFTQLAMKKRKQIVKAMFERTRVDQKVHGLAA